MKEMYENDEVFRGYVRCLPALAFVPEADVQEAFDIVVDAKPGDDQSHENLDALLAFFEQTYLRGK